MSADTELGVKMAESAIRFEIWLRGKKIEEKKCSTRLETGLKSAQNWSANTELALKPASSVTRLI